MRQPLENPCFSFEIMGAITSRKRRDGTGPVAVIEQEARAVALSFGVSTPDDAAAALVERVLMCPLQG